MYFHNFATLRFPTLVQSFFLHLVHRRIYFKLGSNHTAVNFRIPLKIQKIVANANIAREGHLTKTYVIQHGRHNHDAIKIR
jgi:hypothetical protein